jgi:hypothetical protein
MPSASVSQSMAWTSTPAPTAQAHDAVARNRVAAFGQLEGHARCQPLHGDGPLLAAPLLGIGHGCGTTGHERFHDLKIVELGRADGDHQVFLGRELEPLDRFGQRFLPTWGQALDDLS